MPGSQTKIGLRIAEVVLLEGPHDIPTTHPLGIGALYDDLKRGGFGDVVQCAWGHNSNDIDIEVDWALAPYDSPELKVVIIDQLADPWGFIAVSRMDLERYPSPAMPAFAQAWSEY